MLALLALSACGAPRPPAATARADAPLWVLAPHPDDEALMAAHAIATAARAGRPVIVHVMTNGDLGCERDGWLREGETIAAMAELGVPEERVRFLGYPDGHLDALGPIPLAPLERRARDGSCTRGNTTYAGRGEHGVDVHTARTGAPAPYTDASAIDDLVALLERDRPSDVYTSHPIDDHPDHATTYILLRRALERARLDRVPTIHRALVHAGGCWPNGSRPTEPCPEGAVTLDTPYPPLPAPLGGYQPSERERVPDGGRLARRAIAHYRSQLHTHVDGDWLGTFARGDAVAWIETLERDGDRLVRKRARGAPDGEARTIAERLEADPDDPSRTRRVIEASQRAPLEIAFEAEVPDDGSVRVRLLARATDASSGYVVELVDGASVTLARSDRALARVTIPDDGARNARHRWSLRLDPRPDEGGAIELELRRDGQLVAIAVDASPFLHGDRIVATTRGTATLGALDLRI